MKRIRDGLQGNFISLQRAVEAVAARIELTDETLDAFRPLNRSPSKDLQQASYERWPIRRVVAISRAAGRLLPLLNLPLTQRPTWFENTTGFALRNDAVCIEGLKLLDEVRRWESALIASTRPGLRSISAMATVEQVERETAMPRSSQLGFDVDEWIHFLDVHAIPHTLGEPMNAPVEFLHTVVDSPSTGHPVTDLTMSAKNQSVQRTQDFGFKGPLAEVLQTAVNNAAAPQRYRSAFEALRDLARSDQKPIPLLGYNDIEDEVLWNDGDSRIPATFTLKDMKSRYRTVRKHRPS